MARRAFSLLELTLVIVVLATASVIAVPRLMSATRRARLHAAVQRLVQDLNATRERARTMGVYQTFCFSKEGYTIVQRTPTTEQKAEVILTDDPYHAGIGWVKFASGTELSFDGFGVPSSSTCVKVTNGTEAYYVTVAAGSGVSTTSEMKNPSEAATIDASVTPTPIVATLLDIVPVPRITGKVRFTASGSNVVVNIFNIVSLD